MNIKDTFIKLTNKTYPYGYEDKLTSFLPKGYRIDEDGNYFYEIGTDSKNIFACHLDTACKEHSVVKHVIDGKYIRTDKKTVLGADDKAGVTILLYLIYKNIPGLYYFFVGEEVGCIGSTAASKRTEFFSNYNKIVSFDRRGTGSIITHQSSKRSCSDDFADSLSKEYLKFDLKLSKDDTGIYTDSAEFVSVIPECTNISVGYYKEHTHDEHQDIEFLEKLAKASALVDWNSLEIKRDPSKNEWKQYNTEYSNNGNSYYSSRIPSNWKDDQYYDYYPGDGRRRRSTRRGNSSKRSTDKDEDFSNNYLNIEKFYCLDDTTEKNKINKIYLNDLENEVSGDKNIVFLDRDIKENRYKTDYYKGIKRIVLDDTLSYDEFKIIKEQCLDMSDKSDKEFASDMEAQIRPTQLLLLGPGPVNNIR